MGTINTIKVMFAIVVSEYVNQPSLLRCIYRKILLENNNWCCLRIMAKIIKQHKYLHSIKKIAFFGNVWFSEATFLIILKCSICMWRQNLVVQWCSTLPDFSTKDSAEHEHTAKMILEQDTTENSQVLFSSGFKRCPVSSQVSTTYTKKKKTV